MSPAGPDKRDQYKAASPEGFVPAPPIPDEEYSYRVLVNLDGIKQVTVDQMGRVSFIQLSTGELIEESGPAWFESLPRSGPDFLSLAFCFRGVGCVCCPGSG